MAAILPYCCHRAAAQENLGQSFEDVMDYRGPILLIFGATLILSPLAVKMVAEERIEVVRIVKTETGSNRTCSAASVLDIDRSLSCRNNFGKPSPDVESTGGLASMLGQ
jgi:hypothetical protein